jgi:hypothetical protein
MQTLRFVNPGASWRVFSDKKQVKSRFLLGLAIPDDLWYGI